MTERIAHILLRIFYVLLAICPFALAIIYALMYMTGHMIDGRSADFYYLPDLTNYGWAILSLIILGAIIFGATKLKDRFGLTFVLILIASILPRAIILLTYQGQLEPFSDFYRAWGRAIGIEECMDLGYVRYFTSYMNWSIYCKAVIKLFGQNYMAMLWLNVVYNALSACFIYLIAKTIGLTERLSFIASMLFALTPSAIAYTATSTPEHLSILCYLIATYLLLRSFHMEWQSRFSYILGAMIVLGFGDSVKTFGVILIIAFAGAEVIRALLVAAGKGGDKTAARKSGGKTATRKSGGSGRSAILGLITGLIFAGIMYAGDSFIVERITDISEEKFAIELDTADALPHYLCIGLNMEGEGVTNFGEMQYMYIYKRQAGLDRENAVRQTKELILAEWEGNEDYIPSFFLRKNIWSWQDDMRPLTYLLENCGIEPKTAWQKALYNYLSDVGPTMTQLYYLLGMALALYGVISIFRDEEKRGNLLIFYPSLVVMGYFCVMILSEAQSRYKCLIWPFVCILMVCIKNPHFLHKGEEK